MENKAPENCGSCQEKLPKTGDFAVCSGCGNGLHLDSCSIKRRTWNSLGQSGQATWVCSTCRKSKKSSSSTKQDNESDEDEATASNPDSDLEVSSLGVQRAILAKVTSLMDMKGKLDSIETSMKFLADKYDSILKEVNSLRTENKSLKAELEALKVKESASSETISKLGTDLADLDQYGRRFNLEIHGLPMSSQNEDMVAVLDQVAQKIDVRFEPNQIHQAHRLQPRRDGKPPTVIVQFFSKTVRDTWLTKGRKAKITNVFFNENLSPYYRLLLREAKTRAKTHSYKFVWFSGGRVLVKKGENDSILVIKTNEDLKKIR
jgi:regulator of replication initiation timing